MKHSSNNDGRRYSLQVARAALPEVLFIPDLAIALGGISESATRRAVLRGDCGPYVRLGRRLAIRRDALMSALQDREHDPRGHHDGGAS